MELNQIRYFLEVAQSQHVTESAERLHIAQPALSQAISRLEESVGVPLFDKRGRNIVLNEYGEYLKRKLTPIMEELDSLPDKVQSMAKLRRETVHINLLAASALVSSAIISYKKKNENINFKILQNSEEDIFDIEVTTAPHSAKERSGNDRYVCSEEIFLAVPDKAEFKNRKSISLAETEGLEFISLFGSRQFRYVCDLFCKRAGVRPKIVFESDNPAAVKDMIASNMGVGFWPEFTWGEVDRERVKLLRISDFPCKRDIIIKHMQNKEEGGATAVFFEYLRGYLKKQKEKTKIKKQP